MERRLSRRSVQSGKLCQIDDAGAVVQDGLLSLPPPPSPLPAPPPPFPDATGNRFIFMDWLPSCQLNSRRRTASAAFPEVVREIATSQSWSPRDVRFSELDATRGRCGKYLSYEIRFRSKKLSLELKFADDVVRWKRIRKKGGGRADLKRLVSRIRNGKAVLEIYFIGRSI